MFSKSIPILIFLSFCSIVLPYSSVGGQNSIKPITTIPSSPQKEIRWVTENMIASAPFNEDGVVREINLIDIDSQTTVKTFNLETTPQSIEFTNDGSSFAFIDGLYNLYIWEDIEEEPIHFDLDEVAVVHGPAPFPTQLAWDPTGQFIAVNFENYLATVDLKTQNVTVQETDRIISAVAWSMDSHILAYTSRAGQITILEFPELQTVATLEQLTRFIVNTTDTSQQLAWSPDSQKLAIFNTSHLNMMQHIVLVRSTNPDDAPILLEGHSELITAVEWSPDGAWLASSSEDNTVRIWNTQTYDADIVLEFDDDVTTISWMPGENQLAVGTLGDEISIFKIEQP